MELSLENLNFYMLIYEITRDKDKFERLSYCDHNKVRYFASFRDFVKVQS